MSVSRANLSFHLFNLWELCCSLWSPCILNVLVVTLVCGRSPWPMPTLLDALVGALAGEGLCPPGEGLCLPIGPCLPAIWWLGLVCSPYDWAFPPTIWLSTSPLFPFAIRVMPMCCLHYWIKCRCIALSFHHECTNVFLALGLFPLSPFLSPFTRSVPNSPLRKKKSFKLTWNWFLWFLQDFPFFKVSQKWEILLSRWSHYMHK